MRVNARFPGKILLQDRKSREYSARLVVTTVYGKRMVHAKSRQAPCLPTVFTGQVVKKSLPNVNNDSGPLLEDEALFIAFCRL